jgi:hypothetical protein
MVDEAKPHHTNPRHSIDDLFQLLVRVRDIPPAKARQQIFESFQLDRLPVDYHIRGGARKTRPMREPTPEELRRFEALSAALHERKASREEMREEMDRAEAFLYEHAPPEGITQRVNFQSWGSIFGLLISDGHLVVEPKCALDYPWDAYSFTTANWSLVNELWPSSNVGNPDIASSLSSSAAPLPNTPTKPELGPESNPAPAESVVRFEDPRHGWQIDRVYPILRKLYPPVGKVPPGIAASVVWRQVDEDEAIKSENKRRGIRTPSEDVVAKAMNELRRLPD